MAILGIAPSVAGAMQQPLAGGSSTGKARIGAAWRGPKPSDPYYAGVLVADWAKKKISIEVETLLPTRPHGINADIEGGLMIVGVRPGAWIMRTDTQGKEITRGDLANEKYNTRLNGHGEYSSDGKLVYTSETNMRTGRGYIAVRETNNLSKIDEWDSHGLEPHQILLDNNGDLIIANGGIPRTETDAKYDLHRMNSSVVKLDKNTGKILEKWELSDSRLSLRHMAWNFDQEGRKNSLGIALQAEHDDATARKNAPVLAVLADNKLTTPSNDTWGLGYGGDIAAACGIGFAVSSNKSGIAALWQPQKPAAITPIVELEEPYAMTSWRGPGHQGGVLIATGLGLVRWHPSAPALFIPWPKPMALDNHWTILSEA